MVRMRAAAIAGLCTVAEVRAVYAPPPKPPQKLEYADGATNNEQLSAVLGNGFVRIQFSHSGTRYKHDFEVVKHQPYVKEKYEL